MPSQATIFIVNSHEIMTHEPRPCSVCGAQAEVLYKLVIAEPGLPDTISSELRCHLHRA